MQLMDIVYIHWWNHHALQPTKLRFIRIHIFCTISLDTHERSVPEVVDSFTLDHLSGMLLYSLATFLVCRCCCWYCCTHAKCAMISFDCVYSLNDAHFSYQNKYFPEFSFLFVFCFVSVQTGIVNL